MRQQTGMWRPRRHADGRLVAAAVCAGRPLGLPRARLAVLPGTTHVTLITRTEWLLSMIPEFLDAPVPSGK